DITSNSIVKNITWLCKELGIKTIAEFVETESIFIAVKDFGIDYSQGMFISQAIPQISCSSARV
ncbi:MAG TPA: EAL domain-containing protein, partial [Spirochaetota bacterium]|nr:EAL domain-containing protein [Spirochaetota bacterium]